MKKISLFIAISLLLFSACGNKTSKKETNTDAVSDSTEFSEIIESDDNYIHNENVTKVDIAEDVFYVEINNENYPEESCLTIRNEQLEILFQKCYDYTFIEVNEQKDKDILSLVFMSGKYDFDIDFKYVDGDWISESVVYYAMGEKQPDKEISVSLIDFNFGDIQEKWNE